MLASLKKFLFRLEYSAEEREVLKALEENKIHSRKVIGRGTLVMDPAEVVQLEKYKRYAECAERIVKNNKHKS